MSNQIQAFIATSLMVLLLAGCATKSPSFGDSVQAEGKSVLAIGEKWEQGKDLIRKGNKRIRKGNGQIEDGNENVAEGKTMLKTDEKLVAEAEVSYKAIEEKNQ